MKSNNQTNRNLVNRNQIRKSVVMPSCNLHSKSQIHAITEAEPWLSSFRIVSDCFQDIFIWQQCSQTKAGYLPKWLVENSLTGWSPNFPEISWRLRLWVTVQEMFSPHYHVISPNECLKCLTLRKDWKDGGWRREKAVWQEGVRWLIGEGMLNTLSKTCHLWTYVCIYEH